MDAGKVRVLVHNHLVLEVLRFHLRQLSHQFSLDPVVEFLSTLISPRNSQNVAIQNAHIVLEKCRDISHNVKTQLSRCHVQCIAVFHIYFALSVTFVFLAFNTEMLAPSNTSTSPIGSSSSPACSYSYLQQLARPPHQLAYTRISSILLRPL